MPKATIYLMREFIIATTGATLLRLAGIAACVSPLSLHVIGVDFNRWNTLAITTSFLVFCTAHLCRKPADATFPLTTRKVAIPAFLIAMNLGSSIPLFDGYIVQNFPYEEHIDDVVNMITGKLSFPPPPEQCTDSDCMTVIHGLVPRSAVTAKELRAPQR